MYAKNFIVLKFNTNINKKYILFAKFDTEHCVPNS